MFRIKICGVTSVADAQVAMDAGADALGLNFYAKSPRCVRPEIAAEIAAACRQAGVKPIGVFVNETLSRIEQLVQQIGLAAIQLHGDEPPEFLAKFKVDLPLLVAKRIAPSDCGLPQSVLAPYSRKPSALLFDAAAPGHFGGSGQKLDWQSLVDWRSATAGVPVILAGGLTPDNVAEAIRIVRPHGVDTASGVELAPGKKDPAKVRNFVAAATAAFGEIG